MKEATTSEVTTALHQVVAKMRIAQELMERHSDLYARSKAVEIGNAADIADWWICKLVKEN